MKKMLLTALSVATLGLGIVTDGMTTRAKEQTNIANVAHRGASGHAPEHTISAYKAGKQMHGEYIELDLQMTKDGKLIAMHDETLDRTTNGTGRVKDYTLQEIMQLDAGSWFNEKYPKTAKDEYVGLKLPTLEEVFQTFGKNENYYIETKAPNVYPGMEEELLRLIDEYQINKDTLLVQSFSPESLIKMHQLDSSIKLVRVVAYTSPAVISDIELAAIKEYAIGIGPNSKYLSHCS